MSPPGRAPPLFHNHHHQQCGLIRATTSDLWNRAGPCRTLLDPRVVGMWKAFCSHSFSRWHGPLRRPVAVRYATQAVRLSRYRHYATVASRGPPSGRLVTSLDIQRIYFRVRKSRSYDQSSRLRRRSSAKLHSASRRCPDTGKLRVVFDASQVVGDSLLNNHLHTGAKLQKDIAIILTLWRTVVWNAEKMDKNLY